MSRFSSFFRPILTTLLLFSAVSLSGFCPEAPEAAGLPPQETLRSIGASMEAADTASFSKLVDLDGISKQALSELAKLASDPHTSQWMPPTLALMASHGGLTNARVQSFLASEIREFVLYGVGSGGFGGRPVNDYKSQSMFGPLFAMASLGKKQITKISAPPNRSPEAGSFCLLRFMTKTAMTTLWKAFFPLRGTAGASLASIISRNSF